MHELREHAMRLTSALYRVSERFPEHEPLRWHVRECADVILGGISAAWGDEKEMNRVAGKIDAIRNHLLVAREVHWVAPINIDVLVGEYTILRDHLEQAILWEPKEQEREWKETLESLDVPAVIPDVIPAPVSVPVDKGSARKPEKKERSFQEGFNNAKVAPDPAHEPNPRQRKILAHIAVSKEAKISDFFPVLAGVSSKTIQRDLLELVNKNFLKKEGEKRWTTYSLNNVS